MLNELHNRPSKKFWNGDALPSPPDSAYHGRSDYDTPYQDAVTIDLTEYSKVSSEYSCVVGATLESAPKFEIPSPETNSVASLCTSIKDAGTCTGVVCGMDPQTAIDFILE